MTTETTQTTEAQDEVTLTNASASREERVMAAARLCRAADVEQVADGETTCTADESAEQIGTIETMREACDGEPTAADWRLFRRMY